MIYLLCMLLCLGVSMFVPPPPISTFSTEMIVTMTHTVAQMKGQSKFFFLLIFSCLFFTHTHRHTLCHSSQSDDPLTFPLFLYLSVSIFNFSSQFPFSTSGVISPLLMTPFLICSSVDDCRMQNCAQWAKMMWSCSTRKQSSVVSVQFFPPLDWFI